MPTLRFLSHQLSGSEARVTTILQYSIKLYSRFTCLWFSNVMNSSLCVLQWQGSSWTRREPTCLPRENPRRPLACTSPLMALPPQVALFTACANFLHDFVETHMFAWGTQGDLVTLSLHSDLVVRRLHIVTPGTHDVDMSMVDRWADSLPERWRSIWRGRLVQDQQHVLPKPRLTFLRTCWKGTSLHVVFVWSITDCGKFCYQSSQAHKQKPLIEWHMTFWCVQTLVSVSLIGIPKESDAEVMANVHMSILATLHLQAWPNIPFPWLWEKYLFYLKTQRCTGTKYLLSSCVTRQGCGCAHMLYVNPCAYVYGYVCLSVCMFLLFTPIHVVPIHSLKF